MNNLIRQKQLSVFQQAWGWLQLRTRDRWARTSQLRNIARHETLYNQDENAGDYSDELSYRYRLFDLTSSLCLQEFQFYNDRDIGGSSEGDLLYDEKEKHLVIEGNISDRHIEKLTQHPSIGMGRRRGYPIRCGPFNALSLELNSDGLPIHVGCEIDTLLHGTVGCYGIISSKLKGWHTYELPFANMVLVGGENNEKTKNNYLHSNPGTEKTGAVFGMDNYDIRRILLTEVKEVRLGEVNLRLLGTNKVHRRVCLRAIDVLVC